MNNFISIFELSKSALSAYDVISRDKFYISPYYISLDVSKWLKENNIKCKISTTWFGSEGLLFESEIDAMAFKLRWF